MKNITKGYVLDLKRILFIADTKKPGCGDRAFYQNTRTVRKQTRRSSKLLSQF